MLYQTKNPHGGDIYGAEGILDFSANTNPLGTPPGVLKAVQASLPQLHRYPDPYCRMLTRAIVKHEELPEEYILCGSGAAELIYSYCQAVRPGRALELAPTFSEYALGLELVGCTVDRYLLRQENGFAVDRGILDHIEECCPDALFLCNPNNPTGKTMNRGLMNHILAKCSQKGVSLFVDECFLDLCDDGESLKPYLRDHPNLCILKAFTKSYGMAGLRLGYCLCADSQLLHRMSGTVQPWNVSGPAQAAGVSALEEQAFLRKAKALIRTERAWLKKALEAVGFWVCDSEANYLLFHGPEGLHTALLEQKIAIRNCDNYHGLGPGWYRVAVRTHKENEALMDAMASVTGRG